MIDTPLVRVIMVIWALLPHNLREPISFFAGTRSFPLEMTETKQETVCLPLNQAGMSRRRPKERGKPGLSGVDWAEFEGLQF